MVHVRRIGKRKVRLPHEVVPMVLLIFDPVGIHLPQHPLRGHLVGRAAAETAAAVDRELKLECVTQFVRYAVELLVAHAGRRHPQRPDGITYAAAVGRIVEYVVEHAHHKIAVGIRSFVEELQRIAVIGIKLLAFVEDVLRVARHVASGERGRRARVIAEAAVPQQHEVIRADRPPPRITRRLIRGVAAIPHDTFTHLLSAAVGRSLRRHVCRQCCRNTRSEKYGFYKLFHIVTLFDLFYCKYNTRPPDLQTLSQLAVCCIQPSGTKI